MQMPNKVIDFSENVNALGIPTELKTAWPHLLQGLEKYPDPYGEPFRTEVAAFHNVNVANTFIGNGAAEIFTLLAKAFHQQNVAVIHPTFSEYEATLNNEQVTITRLYVEHIETYTLPMAQIEQTMQRVKALYICTPNNPTGVLPPKKQLQQIAKWAQMYACYVIFDEAFIDWIGEEYSMITHRNMYTVIVRSMTKMYAIAGVRLGYVVADEVLIQQFERNASHWHINTVAAQIGKLCLPLENYRQQAIHHANVSRESFSDFLKSFKCRVTNSQTNYICFQLSDASKTQQLYRALLEKGYILRHTENYALLKGEWLRVAIKGQHEMEALKQEMTAWFNGL